MTEPVRVAMVTNIPAPYRLPVYEWLEHEPDLNLCVFFCSGREPDREWDLQRTQVKQVYLREAFIHYRGRFIHCNPDAWSALRRFRPQVVITTGFNPTFLLAYVYARLHGAQHIAMTDGTADTESHLSRIHRWVRRWVYGGTRAFIGASQGSFALYRQYGVLPARMFQSHLCADNAAYTPRAWADKAFDFVFSGRFVAAKNPDFALRVAQEVARRLGRRTRLLMLGSGELEPSLTAQAHAMREEVDVVFAGFVKQADLPAHYASAKVLLFPTQIDTWGVVVNEACAAGLPVLVTPMAGVAHELVVDGLNGHVLPLDVAQWVAHALPLVSDAEHHAAQSQASVQAVSRFTYRHAAQGIADAVRSVAKGAR